MRTQGLSLSHRGAVLGLGLLAAACVGAMAGRSPAIALGAVLAVAAITVIVADLAVGILVFTLASFLDDLSVSRAATAGKVVGLVLLVGWIATVAIARRQDRRELVSDQPVLVGFATLFLAWNLLSVAWAQSPSTALSGTSRYAMNLALFPILYVGVRHVRHVRWVVVAFVAGAVLSVLYGTLAGTTAAGSASRLAGALGDPNETAMVLVASAALALALAGAARRGSKAQLFALAAGLGSLVAIVETGSRGGLVALAASILAGILMADRWRGRGLAVALVATALGVGFFVAFVPASTRQHVTAGGTDGRSTLWLLAERSIEANPVQGLGNDNFQDDAKDYLLEPGLTDGAGLVIQTPKVAHNIYLEMWSDLGIVGLLLFLGIVLASLRCALAAVEALKRAGRRADELVARGVLVAIVGMLAADFFISDIYSKQLWLLLALAPAMLAAARAELPARADAPARALRG